MPLEVFRSRVAADRFVEHRDGMGAGRDLALTVGEEHAVRAIHGGEVVAREALAQPVQRIVSEVVQIALRQRTAGKAPGGRGKAMATLKRLFQR